MRTIPIRHLNTTPTEADFSQSFRVRDLGDLLREKDMVQELHRHNFFFVLAMEKGKGTHEIDFVPYEVDDRCIFLVRPGQVHQLTLKAGGTGYLMGFSTGFYQRKEKGAHDILRKAVNTNVCRIDGQAFARLYSILSCMFSEYRDRKEGYRDIIRAYLDIFLLELVRNRQQDISASAKNNLYQQERLEQFLELVETHLTTGKQVSDYAAMLNLSVYQLNTVTKSVLGKTPSEIINEHIILESKRYLLATSDQVSQIAYRLGYEDPSYFIRFFKKHTGHSPEVFRSNFK